MRRLMDADTALIVESYRNRRRLAHELLGELAQAIEARQPQHVVRAEGKREVGLALFQRYRVTSATRKI